MRYKTSCCIYNINKVISTNNYGVLLKNCNLNFMPQLNNFHFFSKTLNRCKQVSKIYIALYSTCSQNLKSHDILHEVLKLRDENITNSFIDSKVNELCNYYKCLTTEEKHNFILNLACNFSVHHEDVCKIANTLINNNYNKTQNVRLQEKLKTALTPKYKWLFIHVGRQENGVKFLVDMRTEVLALLNMKNKIEDCNIAYLKQLNNTLRELFLLWFSVGFLKLERLTWKSSCEMLQKISDYEAVHPVRNWTDLKTRLGRDRRCFVYTHSSMPEEPLVILHTALRQEIVNSTSSMIAQNNQTDEIKKYSDAYHPENVKAAIFYSISSTQIGLQGIELGNYIIKRVATEVAKEFPTVTQFSSLSPVPQFKNWLFDILKRANNDQQFADDNFYKEEVECLKILLKNDLIFKELMKQLSSNIWLQNSDLVEFMKKLLMRMCVRYLYLEKKRGYALDGVANFHLRNGAEMWRINWLADISARGLTTSCGIMVNYRYYLDAAENNSRTYIEEKKIVISPLVKKLLEENYTI